MLQRNQLHNYLIVALYFTFTINTFASFALTFLITLFWFITGDLRKKVAIILHHPLSLTFLALFGMHLIGLIWTQDMHDGLKILSKQKTYILAPLILSFFHPKFTRSAIIALLAAIFISECYSLYLYLHSVPDARGLLPSASPFMHHMHFSLILAFTFGYLIYMIDFHALKKPKNIALLLFALFTIVILFINKGRIGQVALFAVIFLLGIYKFHWGALKSTLLLLVSILTIGTLAYRFSYQFQSRVAEADYEYHKVIGKGKRDSISCRFEMWSYAKKLGDSAPLIGIGTGDSIPEMEHLIGKESLDKLYDDCGLGIRYQLNPHNNFMLYYMQFGWLGLMILLGVLFTQLKLAQKLHSPPMMILIIVTIIGMFSASPISMHIKYIFFYALTLTLLYLDAKQHAPSDRQSE